MPFSWGDGFDCYPTGTGIDQTAGYWDLSLVPGQWNFAAGRFAGSQALVLNTNSPTLVKSSGQNDSIHHICVAFMQTATMGTSALAGYLQLLDGTTAQCTIVFNRNGTITLASGGPTGTTLATYPSAITVQSTWYQFEFEIVVHNSTGSFKVRRNGNPIDDHSTTGIDTAGGTANNYANKLQVGVNTAVTNQHFDDLFWRSDASSVAWLGDIRCHTRMPASDAAVQWSRSTGATNFSCVDEPQQNTTTDYVYSSTPGHEDYYGIAAIASTPLQTFMVTTRAYMTKSDAGTRTAAAQLKSGGTTVASPTVVLTTSGWQWAWVSSTTDPATGAAWTAVAVQNAQASVKVIA